MAGFVAIKEMQQGYMLVNLDRADVVQEVAHPNGGKSVRIDIGGRVLYATGPLASIAPALARDLKALSDCEGTIGK